MEENKATTTPKSTWAIPANILGLEKLQTDSHNRCLQGVYFDGGKVVATNGLAMAILPYTTDPELAVPQGSIVRIEKPGKKGHIGLFHRVTGTQMVNTETGGQIDDMTEVLGQYAQYKAAIPDMSKTKYLVISLDAKLLKELADSLSADGKDRIVDLAIDTKNETAPILVSRGDGVGVLMPCRTSATPETMEAKVKELLAR